MTLAQFKNTAAAQGAEVDEHGGFVGVKFKNKHVWHWFLDCAGHLVFDHSYSMNTGRTKRRHSASVWNFIFKAIPSC